jgi:DNA-binding GntR family transcriptional regulator
LTAYVILGKKTPVGIPYIILRILKPLRRIAVSAQNFSTKFLPPHSTAVEVSRYLQRAILHDELKPGARLIERDLSKTLGVSRIPIREAFRILERRGLVQVIPRKGAQVTAFTKQEIEEIYTLRANLVSLAAKLAARNLDRKGLEKLSRLGERMRERARRNDLKGYFLRLVEFHDHLSEASGNRRLHQILEMLGKQTIRFRYTALSRPGMLQKSNAFHQELIRALKRGDGNTAGKMARRTIKEGRRHLLKYLSSLPENGEPIPGNPELKIPKIIHSGSL